MIVLRYQGRDPLATVLAVVVPSIRMRSNVERMVVVRTEWQESLPAVIAWTGISVRHPGRTYHCIWLG